MSLILPPNYNPKKILENRVIYKNLADNDPDARARFLELANRDIVWWVNHFCWCFEPRNESEFPIVLFDYQAQALQEWNEHLAYGRGDIVIEKCRDMGITWLMLYLLLYWWRFRASSNFLISSFREQEVDFQDSMSTLFPKLRFVTDRWPAWMLPRGFVRKRHSTYMRLFNPENNSLITGSAPVPNFGRGGRYKAIIFDEFPQWEFGEAAYASSSQSTAIRMFNGTPYGRDNCYARLVHDEDTIRVDLKK